MNLSIRDMCLLSAAAGWIACGVCFWIFPRWRTPDIHRMSYSELKNLLLEIKREYIARNPDAPTAAASTALMDEAQKIYDAERNNGKSSGR